MCGMFWAAIELGSAAIAYTKLDSNWQKHYLVGKTELAEW